MELWRCLLLSVLVQLLLSLASQARIYNPPASPDPLPSEQTSSTEPLAQSAGVHRPHIPGGAESASAGSTSGSSAGEAKLGASAALDFDQQASSNSSEVVVQGSVACMNCSSMDYLYAIPDVMAVLRCSGLMLSAVTDGDGVYTFESQGNLPEDCIVSVDNRTLPASCDVELPSEYNHAPVLLPNGSEYYYVGSFYYLDGSDC